MDHSIVFSGRLRPGISIEEARANVARLFKLEPGPQLDRLFSGKPVTLKKGLSEEQARKYADALLKAGAICEIVGGLPQPLTAVIPAPAPVASPSPPGFGGLSGLALMPMEKPPETALEPEPEPVRLPAAQNSAVPSSPYAVSPSSRRQQEPLLVSNNSGGGTGTYLPDEAQGLCWGGFLMNWIWGVCNGTYIALLALLPVAGFIMPFYLLFKGRELAWRNKRWDSVEHFNRVQRNWSIAGLVLTILTFWFMFSLGD
jgi:hypothetical protein